MLAFEHSMIQKKHFFWNLFFISLFISVFLFSFAEQNYSLQEAQKVLKAIDKIVDEQFRKDKDSLKKIIITESELNSYIAYRIETEKEEIMKELSLKLFKANRIEGKIFIDLTGQKIPKFLRPRMVFYFGGELIVKESQAKLDFKELYLEGQPIQPLILDLIIYIASKLENTEASSINDWYELPYGIKNIETQKGKAIFYY